MPHLLYLTHTQKERKGAMSLGETIHRLRTEKGMSQGDLADALEVSRQSISKWETESAVPELEKLVRLSQLFGVTLDELVNGEKAPPPPEPPPEPPAAAPEEKEKRRPARKTSGVVLLCIGALAWLLLTVAWGAGGLLLGLIFAAPFLLCSIICFACQRNAGLWCAWVVFFILDAFLCYFTGISWRLVFLTGRLEPSIYLYDTDLYLTAAWVLLGLIALLVFVTVVRLREKPFQPTRAHLYHLIAGWGLFAVLNIPILTTIPASEEGWKLVASENLLFKLLEWLWMGVLTAALTYTVRYIRTKRAK